MSFAQVPSLPTKPLPLALSSSDTKLKSTSLNQMSYLDVYPEPQADARSSRTSIILSPRTLYAQYADVPASTTREKGPGGRYRKDLNVLTGYDATPETEAEFDALPIAVRKKYFSTLERLTFAQSSYTTPQAASPMQYYPRPDYSLHHSRHSSQSSSMMMMAMAGGSASRIRPSSPKSTSSRPNTTLAERRGKRLAQLQTRQVPCLPRQPANVRQSTASPITSQDSSLAEKMKGKPMKQVKKRHFEAHPRRSVRLDSLGRVTQRASPGKSEKTLSPLEFKPPSLRQIDVKDHSATEDYTRVLNRHQRIGTTNIISKEIYDTFRWIDDEPEIDARSALDDYHANLDGTTLSTRTHNRKPSFRRQVSINRTPLGKRYTQPQTAPLGYPSLRSYHSQQKSQTSSLSPKSPRHRVRACTSVKNDTISLRQDSPNYTQPQTNYLPSRVARNRLRSNSLFIDSLSSRPYETVPKQQTTTADKSFLVDDSTSLSDDGASTKDPESPLTPCAEISLQSPDSRKQPTNSISSNTVSPPKVSQDLSHPGAIRPMIVKQIDSPNLSCGSREITLRMTLTRPDLRVDEAKIYAWQDAKLPHHTRVLSEAAEKYFARGSCGGPLGGPDGWGPDDKDASVVKRFWNKVTQNRKVSLA
ncbi:Bgt-3482 [Blumeria graminis f. sp. tritici]|uniref:Bgt-3482 n=2 Tax=Blumeria graminis f. sp. tritici TaxID=62690 RepID=A0A061HJ89_BLUGR|nr:hypothetical protein BGT96224_3482 [Blumeria graminis f. sp. tritici 96224]VDB93903.1 Bgt-3482 [Blumeria graminis f. sp. tritici]